MIVPVSLAGTSLRVRGAPSIGPHAQDSQTKGGEANGQCRVTHGPPPTPSCRHIEHVAKVLNIEHLAKVFSGLPSIPFVE
jgi:hypothetical protein